jgi:hypothetical protein
VRVGSANTRARADTVAILLVVFTALLLKNGSFIAEPFRKHKQSKAVAVPAKLND